MSDGAHVFPSSQATYLRAWRDGRCRPAELSRRYPASVSLVDRLPPVYQQSMRGTCVANAVTALLEYYGDCKTRLSVQFLYEAVKSYEREGLERNLAAVASGGKLDPGFEAVFHSQLLQLRMLADANGADSPAYRPFLQKFIDGARARFRQHDGSLVRTTFAAAERFGTCRYALWPYAGAVAAPLFGEASDDQLAFPPGTREDALKRRVISGVYLLRTPNNVDEIRGILAGANARRPMPVCVSMALFEGCDDETFALPPTEERADGALVAAVPSKGVHGMLLVGYEDDAKLPGGGAFIVRNSWGDGWGKGGYGRVPYAYVECFALEAGTILQDMIDYLGDGYDGQTAAYAFSELREKERRRRRRFWLKLVVNLAIALLIIAITIAVGVLFNDPLNLGK